MKVVRLMADPTITAMADQNQMGSELSPVDPMTLAWAEYWYPIAWKGLLAASAATILAACLAAIFLLLQWRTTTIRERQSDWRTSALELQTAQAKRETVKAAERVAKLNNETEHLKADNLALQMVLLPSLTASQLSTSTLC